MADTRRVAVEQGTCACHSVHTIRAHHHDFPEIWAQGGSPAEAADRLASQLALALDSSSSRRRRLPLVEALADVRAYIVSLGPTVHGKSPSACDYPSCEAGVTSPAGRPPS